MAAAENAFGAGAYEHGVCEIGADPMRTDVTEDRSVRASRASSRSIIAIIVGTEVSAVTPSAPIASI